jgi:hypothetical protein
MPLLICQLDDVDTQYDNDFPDVPGRLPKTAVRKSNIVKFPINVQEYFRHTVAKRTLRNIADQLRKR